MIFSLQAMARVLPLILFAGLPAFADECGQSGGNGSLSAAISSLKEAQDRHCEGQGKKTQLLQQSQVCNAESSSRDAVAGANSYLAKIEDLCAASKYALEQAKHTCQENKKAVEKTDAFQTQITELARQGRNPTEIQASLQAEKSALEVQLQSVRSTARALEKEKVLDRVVVAKSAGKALDTAAEAEARKRQQKVKEAERAWQRCQTQTCDAQAKQEFRKRAQERDASLKTCRNMLSLRDEIERDREDFGKKLKQLADATQRVSLDNGSISEALAKDISNTGGRLNSLKSEPHSRIVSGTNGERAPAGVTREARDLPPEVSGRRPDGKVGLVQEAKATFYPGREAGRDGYEYAAASNLFPHGSVLRVTNLDNGREVELIVNDDGFFREQTCRNSLSPACYAGSRGVGIDVNDEAASALGMRRAGIVNARIVRVR